MLDFLPNFDAAEDDKRRLQKRKTDPRQAAHETTNGCRLQDEARSGGNRQRASRMPADIDAGVVDGSPGSRRQVASGLCGGFSSTLVHVGISHLSGGLRLKSSRFLG